MSLSFSLLPSLFPRQTYVFNYLVQVYNYVQCSWKLSFLGIERDRESKREREMLELSQTKGISDKDKFMGNERRKARYAHEWNRNDTSLISIASRQKVSSTETFYFYVWIGILCPPQPAVTGQEKNCKRLKGTFPISSYHITMVNSHIDAHTNRNLMDIYPSVLRPANV